MLLPLKYCAFSVKNNQVQRPNIFWWTFAFRTSVAAVSRRCPPGVFVPGGGCCAGRIKGIITHKAWLLLFLMVLAPVVVSGEQITKIGILNIEKVYAVYFRESRAVKQLQEKQSSIIKEINRINEEILNLESEKLAAESRNDMQRALELDTEIFNKKQYREDYKRIKMQQLKKISENLYQSDEFLDELLAAINYVAESGGFSVVLNNSRQFSQFFFFYTKEIDITEKVIQELMTRAGRQYRGRTGG